MSNRVDIIEDELHKWDIVVGEVVSTHGLKGEVKVYLHTEVQEHFSVGRSLCLVSPKGRRQKVTIVGSRRKGRVMILKVDGINQVEQAEALKGFLLTVASTDRPKLAPGEFLVRDLIGLEVVTADGVSLGCITEVLPTPAHDVYVTPRALIPAVRQVIKHVDLKSRKMTIEALPSLLE